MASIAIITNTGDATANDSAGKLETALESAGAGSHTATIIDDANIGVTDFSGYNVIAVTWPTLADRATIAAALRDLCDNDGKPMLFGLRDSGSSSGQTNVAATVTSMGICGNINTTAHNGMTMRDITHPITDAYSQDEVVNLYSTSGSAGVVPDGTFIGDELGDAGATPNLIAISAGTSYLDSGTTGAKIVICGQLSANSTTTYTAAAATLFGAIVEWLTTVDGGGGVAANGSLLLLGVGT